MERRAHGASRAWTNARQRRARRREGIDAFLARLDEQARAADGKPWLLVLAPADASRLVRIARRLARGRSADDLRLGERLAALRQHDLVLGYNGIGDLALDRLGTDPQHARWLASIAGKLQNRPLLRAAVVSGELSLRKADAVVDAAVGDALERYWLARAKHETVRALEAATKPGVNPYDDGWRDVLARLETSDEKVCVEFAFGVAAVILGDLDAPKWKIIQALSMEYLGGHPLPLEELEAATRAGPSDAAREVPASRAAPTPPTPPAAPAFPRPRPQELLRQLEALVKDRLPDDERLGKALLLVRPFHAYKLAGARTMEAFCVEELGMAPSTARQRMALERRLRGLPELREALRTGVLSYEQARAVAKVASPSDVTARIDAAAFKPALDTRREVQAEQDRQMWRTGELRTSLPRDADEDFALAVRSMRSRATRPLTAGQALALLSVHFIDVWLPLATALLEKADEVLLRNGGRCEVPGCSHRSQHVHHIRFRSRGGPSTPDNLVGVCEAHHLIAIHKGYLRLTGTAPDGLVWEFLGRDLLELALLHPDDPAERNVRTVRTTPAGGVVYPEVAA